MSIPPSLNALIEQLNQEIAQIDEDATVGLSLVRDFLARFPDNARLIQFFASFSNAILFAEIERRRIQSILVNLTFVEQLTDAERQEVGEDLSNELGKVLETKIIVSTLKQRLENLQ
ncbi:restriction endonuclease subunit S [Aphanothece hegewaldii CCALA 016]|uniref:Restriction endonuclease subunit S n=1 Tax=Aphanothece hegewaldii CCALA 016 TaxID=2107694 RepID=A0A2T1LSL6_9CHRO|nr:restriction endonuclease subunit S [Aphanothece hegewaldii]PSF33037.1 restriction endonuclease subunit S [Aphanothece hegewaldii CCALA 016]